MRQEVCYLMSGVPHMPYLVVSLWTLRQWWLGPIVVHAFPNSINHVEEISKDTRLGIEVVRHRPAYEGKNDQFLAKIQVMKAPGADLRLYLDADTSIHGCLSPVFGAAEACGFAATQFNEWMTKGRIVANRIERLRQFEEIPDIIIDEVLRPPYYPSLNGGVFACRPSSPVLPQWYAWSYASKSVFICDEACLHLLQVQFPDNQFTVVRGGQYNCSHRYQGDIENVVVYHYHGDSNVRPNKSQKAVDFWMPMYRECLDQNIGNIQSWINQAVSTNKFMKDAPEYRYGTHQV